MSKQIGIMQPYFLPYMGYWQLINAVDEFILYDNIEYTKKGWINRNRFLSNDQDKLFSLPLESASDFLPVYERHLSKSFERDKLLRQLKEAYKKAPYFEENFSVIETIIQYHNQNLFAYIENSITTLCAYLGIQTPIIRSSSLSLNHETLKAKDKVIAICNVRGADRYLNPIGGLTLYKKDEFRDAGISLSFMRSQSLDYRQFNHDFIPHLSILDVLMFNSKTQVQTYLDRFTIE